MYRIVLLLLFACIGAAHAGQGRDAFDAFRDQLVTLSAQFQQTVLDTENGTSGTFSGTFQLHRPDRFRWVYQSPEQRRVIADGRSVWVIDDELDHITQLPQSLTLKDTPANVLLSEQPIDDTFVVSELGEHQQLQWLGLQPKDNEGDLVQLLLAFQGQQLKVLEVTDKFGQTSRFTFSDMQRNPGLSDRLFDYQPPDDWFPSDS